MTAPVYAFSFRGSPAAKVVNGAKTVDETVKFTFTELGFCFDLAQFNFDLDDWLDHYHSFIYRVNRRQIPFIIPLFELLCIFPLILLQIVQCVLDHDVRLRTDRF